MPDFVNGKRVMDMNGLHLILSIPFALGMLAVTILMIIHLDRLELEVRPIVIISANIWLILLLPISFYFGFFTKFNNPFRRVKVENTK